MSNKTIKNLIKIPIYLLITLTISSCNQTESSITRKYDRIEKNIAELSKNRKDLNLNGNVRSIIEYEIEPEDFAFTEIQDLGDIDIKYISADTLISRIRATNIHKSHSYLFDKNGNPIKSVLWYRIAGQADSRQTSTYKFNNKNQLVRKEEYRDRAYSGKSELVHEVSFQYNKLGKPIHGLSIRHVDNKTFKRDINYTYKELGIYIVGSEVELKKGDTINIFNSIIYHNGTSSSADDKRRKYEFNEDGDVSKSIYVDPFSGERRILHIYSYDSESNLIQDTHYDEYEEMSWTKYYTYKEGNLIATTNHEYDGWNSEYFNENGELLKTQRFSKSDSMLEYHETYYTYDHLDNLISRKISYSDGISAERVTNYWKEYIYDDNNNWTECKNYENDSLVRIERREILYY